MATVVVPTLDQWDQLREIGLFSDNGIILVHPNEAKKHDLDPDDEALYMYDFGEDPDIWVDIVSEGAHHHIWDLIEERKEGEDER